ncbi:MAG: flagellar assembly protein FliX [Alphaproteobacteria bacterium]|nr:flagellar assembly protein FliX [Alphaproteobacteria bacterium]
MKIVQPPLVSSSLAAKPAAVAGENRANASQAARFSTLLDGGGVKGPVATQAGRAGATLAGHGLYGLDALLAAQEVGDEPQRRRRAKQRAEEILKVLERIRNDLLSGEISIEALRQLTATLNQDRSSFIDPKLNEILDEIDLLAQVELAKYS